MKPQRCLLLHPAFVAFLALLLLNDLYLKYAFHNWLTGKLSDFAGLFVFAIFFSVFFPAYKKTVFVFTCLFFLWWKSRFSDSFIYFLNTDLLLPVHRVVDYTDSLALAVLPFAYRVKPIAGTSSFIRPMAVYCIGIVSFFSFCSTSMPRQLMYYPYRQNEVHFGEQYSTAKTENEILEKLRSAGINYHRDSVRYYPVREYDFYRHIIGRNDSAGIWQPVPNNKDSSLFIKRAQEIFYVLPEYVIEVDTLRNVEFTIYKNSKRKKSTSIYLESFQTNNFHRYDDYTKLRKKYRKNFKELFE